jgi:DNA-binding NarL/FixJ family response regulator
MSGQRVLVVEDEADARELTVRGLRRLGWQADGAEDGLAALEMLAQGWDAVVTDIRMPRLDGLQLLAELRTRLPGAVRIVVTSFGDKDNVLAALNGGAGYLLEKPFAVRQLADLLGRLLAETGTATGIDQLFERRLATLPLAPREREMVVLVLKGLANKEIAAAMGIGEQSVKNALGAAYARLGVSSRGQLFHRVFPV